MRDNALKKIWARGEAVVSGWLSIPSGCSAEVMTHQGFDSLNEDLHQTRRGVPGHAGHETAEALKNPDQILSVDGVDAIYVGPSDLSLAVGLKPRLDQTDPPVVDAQEKIAAACKRHNAIATYALKIIAEGYRFVTLASDSRHMAAKAAEEVGIVRKTGTKVGKLPAS